MTHGQTYIHTYRQTDRQGYRRTDRLTDMTKLIACFLNFVKPPEKFVTAHDCVSPSLFTHFCVPQTVYCACFNGRPVKLLEIKTSDLSAEIDM